MAFNTNILKEWPNRIKSRMKALGMTQEMLASKMGITRGAITHYLSGRRVPPLKQFEKMALVLHTDAAWLQYGFIVEYDPETQLPKYQPRDELPSLYPIPILSSWEQIDVISDMSKLDRQKVTQWIPRMYSDGLQSFALIVKGDAMTAPFGHMDSYREGDLVQFDNDRTVKHGDYVVAILPNAKEATFRQYVTDGGTTYLKPINPQFPLVPMCSETKICGVQIYHISKSSLKDRFSQAEGNE